MLHLGGRAVLQERDSGDVRLTDDQDLRRRGLETMSEVYAWEVQDGPGEFFRYTITDGRKNATGTFTKVVQRVPVRIRLRELPAGFALRPGMSVEVDVDTSTSSSSEG